MSLTNECLMGRQSNRSFDIGSSRRIAFKGPAPMVMHCASVDSWKSASAAEMASRTSLAKELGSFRDSIDKLECALCLRWKCKFASSE